MSVASRQAAGWVTKAAASFARGGDRADFVQSMMPYAPGENYLTVNRIWELGRQAAIAGQLLDQAAPTAPLPAARIPGQRGGGGTFHYLVVGVWEASGGAGTQYRTLTVDSPYQLSRSQIEDQLRGLTPQQQVAALGVGFPPTQIAEWRLTRADVISVERR